MAQKERVIFCLTATNVGVRCEVFTGFWITTPDHIGKYNVLPSSRLVVVVIDLLFISLVVGPAAIALLLCSHIIPACLISSLLLLLPGGNRYVVFMLQFKFKLSIA